MVVPLAARSGRSPSRATALVPRHSTGMVRLVPHGFVWYPKQFQKVFALQCLYLLIPTSIFRHTCSRTLPGLSGTGGIVFSQGLGVGNKSEVPRPKIARFPLLFNICMFLSNSGWSTTGPMH